MIAFDTSYARLPARFAARIAPTPVPDPRFLWRNDALAVRLGLDPADLTADLLGGNAVPDGVQPLAMAYAGHQFGGFSPQLGDGRALLLGEVVAPDGARFDVQLKGAGPTPFSRRGDGRAWLGPVLREYVVSEFMAACGVPTTRALAAVTTGDSVFREGPRPGAVLTRVAASHIRIGTFEYFAARGDAEALAALTAHVIARHHPQADGPLALLHAVIAAQAGTVAAWMGLGFVHGVMNTDNMTVSGETIDYGPCAFIDAYHPDRVFSSIDSAGRYRWSNQPQIAAWNLAQFASCLIPLMGDEDAAIAAATEAVNGFAPRYQAAWRAVFGAKLGVDLTADTTLADRLLSLMARQGADFTRVFAGLTDGSARAEFADPAAFDAWAADWRSRDPDAAAMAAANPRRIPRTHRIEAAIAAAVAGDRAPADRLLAACTAPFDDVPDWADLSAAPTPDEIVPRTFCGT